MATLSRIIILLQLFSVFSGVIGDSHTDRFTVTRGESDSFPNPDCDSTTCPNICDRYNAKCSLTDESTYPCTVCYCNTKTGKHTFVGSGSKHGSRCQAVDEVVKESVPKKKIYISSYDKDNVVEKCMAVNPKLFLKDGGYCEDSDDEIEKATAWIYTKHQRFMNLNRLNCLTVGPGNKVMVSPCKLNDDKQQWSCESSTKLVFHRERDASRMFIDHKLTLTNSSHWARFRTADSCPKPLEYQGCYRFNDGSLMRNLGFRPKGECESPKSCFTAMKVLAPIYEENSNCFINWQTSSYLVDNKPWQFVSAPDKDMSVSDSKNSRGIYVKVSYASYASWSGKVLKLQVNCSSKTTSEEHCVLIKFPSKIQDFSSPDTEEGEKKKSKSRNAYKISTIVLSVLVFVILLSIVVYFVMRSSMCKMLTRSRHHTSAEIPFCGETDAEPTEM